MNTNGKASLTFAVTALAWANFAINATAFDIPAQLPAPDGNAGDTAKPVRIYILAGQSNMVGMGDLRGARNRYTGIYLTADPAAPKGAT